MKFKNPFYLILLLPIGSIFLGSLFFMNKNIKKSLKQVIPTYREIDQLRNKDKDFERTKEVLEGFMPFAIENDLKIKNSLISLKFKKKEKVLEHENSKILLKEFKPYRNIIMLGINNYVPGSAYLEKDKKNIFLLSSVGILGYSEYNNSSLEFKQIENNLNNFITKERLLSSRKFTVRDLFIRDGNIYISYLNELKENCWNISILSGAINYSKINFKSFYSPGECIYEIDNKDKVFNALQTGGRIIGLDENNILLSTGEFRSRYLAQDKKSIFGKILKINIQNKDIEILSMGHRNIQGLYFDNTNKLIISTEHGPKGGDEINILEISKSSANNVPNYGWPNSSYGEHYASRQFLKFWGSIENNPYKKYPLHKSHKKYGYIEPKKYYDPSIGISEIIAINEKQKIYMHASLKDSSLYIFKLNKENNITRVVKLTIGERIRDLIRFENKFLLFLEDSGSIAELQLKELEAVIQLNNK